MIGIEKIFGENIDKYNKLFLDALKDCIPEKKEEPTMKVSYNGFTGLLLKLEAQISELRLISGASPYSLCIWDENKHVTYSFNGVNLMDVKFLGGAVSFVE